MLQCENGRNRMTTTPRSHISHFKIPHDFFTLQEINQSPMNISKKKILPK